MAEERVGADRPRVALLHYRDARDVRNWSGTIHFSKAAVDRHVGPVVDLSPAPVSWLPFRAVGKVVRSAGRNYNFEHDPLLARYFGWYFTRAVRRAGPDLLFVPGASACLWHLKSDVPYVYFTDGPWRAIREYNPFFRNVLQRTGRAADAMERAALEGAAVVVVSSDWAAESAVRDYGIDPGKVHTLFIGANLPDAPRREDVLPRTLGTPIRLLMVGVLWDLKGGDIALETLISLLDRGFDAELTVVGCTPPLGVEHPRMRVHPFLDKQVPAELERFLSSWREADFFILPTRSEAAGVVFCEASAYGIPTLATRTGGVPSLVAEGENGFTLPLEARGDRYADRIIEVVRDPAGYARLCERSRDAFEERLNWDRWGARLSEIVGEALPRVRRGATGEGAVRG